MQPEFVITVSLNPMAEFELENLIPHFEAALESGLLTESDVDQIAGEIVERNLEVT